MLLDQAQKIQKQQYQPDIIIAIAKGGVIPAQILSDLIETTQPSTIQIEFYQNIVQPKSEPTLKKPLSTSIKGKKILLVDDISDTGKTLKFAQTYLQEQGTTEIRTATLYFKSQSITKPDFYEKKTNNWVIFPWEIKETLRKITQKSVGKRAANQEIRKLVKAGLPKQLIEKLLKTI
jgi:hypothetical protein